MRRDEHDATRAKRRRPILRSAATNRALTAPRERPHGVGQHPPRRSATLTSDTGDAPGTRPSRPSAKPGTRRTRRRPAASASRAFTPRPPRRIRARSPNAALGTGRASRAPSASPSPPPPPPPPFSVFTSPAVLRLCSHRLRRLRPSTSRSSLADDDPAPDPTASFAPGALAGTRGIRAPRGLASRAGGTLQRVNLAGGSAAAEERRGRLPLAVIDAEAAEAGDASEAPEEDRLTRGCFRPVRTLPLRAHPEGTTRVVHVAPTHSARRVPGPSRGLLSEDEKRLGREARANAPARRRDGTRLATSARATRARGARGCRRRPWTSTRPGPGSPTCGGIGPGRRAVASPAREGLRAAGRGPV